MNIILASTSIYRKQLLEKIHLTFQCDKPDIDESEKPGESPQALVARLAIEKAQACQHNHKNALIIGSDQVACHQGKILGKPHTTEKAIEQLMSFSDSVVTFYTGLALLNSSTGQYQSHVEPFEVHFKALTLQQVQRYVEVEQPLNCAGSFKSEGYGITLFSKLNGEDPNSLIGLPLIQLCNMLEKEGVSVL